MRQNARSRTAVVSSRRAAILAAVSCLSAVIPAAVNAAPADPAATAASSAAAVADEAGASRRAIGRLVAGELGSGAAADRGDAQFVELDADGNPVTKDYVIGKEDVLFISLFGEQALTMPQVPVRPDGKISLPLLGDVLAEGRTPEELGQALEKLYEEHVLAPSVTVIVVQINSFKVYLLGSVGRQGVLQFGRDTTLLQALAMAGGLGQFANTKRILIIREEADGPRRIEVNYEKIVSGENMAMNLRLKPGDTIVVP